jgi:hypothetical protein
MRTLIVLILCLLAGASPSWATSTEPKPNQKSITSLTKVVETTALPKQTAIVDNSQEQPNRQEESAAAWWLVNVTGVLALIGILQLIVFGIQAYQLRKTVVEMKAGTAATVESANAAKKSADAIQ